MLLACPEAKAEVNAKPTLHPRVIVSSDFPPVDVIPIKAPPGGPPEKRSDPDDVQSMVRFLLYANEFDVEGLVASAGTIANVANKKHILDVLDLYAQVYPNLKDHDFRYPTPDRLRSITFQGLSGTYGTDKRLEDVLGDGKDTEASDAIIRVVDKPDARPVWVLLWGGTREVAQAIWKVQQTRKPAQFERFLSKLRLYAIAKQDSRTDWLLGSFPRLFVILSEKNYMGMFAGAAGADAELADLAWIDAHVRHGRGPLGAAYPRSGWDPAQPGQQEGDTPSFLHLASAIRGLNDPEKPDQPGWGGRFVRPERAKNHWFDDPVGTSTVSRWRPEVQADFAHRANWMVVGSDRATAVADDRVRKMTSEKNQKIERWGLYEAEFAGPAGPGSFADVELRAEFHHGDRRVLVDGFTDGDGVYRLRLMPDTEGEWTFTTSSNVPELDGKSGAFVCVAPGPKNHGPVVVKGTRFAYADGTRYSCFGTTCYAWIHQPEALQEETIRTLASGPFDKIRMCVFPKSYAYNSNEPDRFPYAKDANGKFDLRRFDPSFWHNLERRIGQLRDLGIEADIILFHPYDGGRWGFDRMGKESDDFYLRYAVARLAAFRNVWWSLANEYDFMGEKRPEDWDRFFQILEQRDPYQRLRSIHNGVKWYDHAKPWVTHASVQNPDPVQAAKWIEQFGKPVVYDECMYEGNIESLWGDLTPQQMTQRFWDGFLHGGYVGHGETYVEPNEILWWSKGGVLHGQSPARIAFLRKILEEAPASLARDHDMFGWESGAIGVMDIPGKYYLVYFGPFQPKIKDLPLPAEGRFTIEVIDTWNMTVQSLPGTFSGKCRVELPGKPYIALRICRSD